MEWKQLTKIDAADCLQNYQNLGYDRFIRMCEEISASDLPEEYKALRTELVEAFRKTNQEADRLCLSRSRSLENGRAIGKAYCKDVLFGAKVYAILKKKGMNVRYASNSKIWNYIAVKVIPDLVFYRYGEDTYKKKHDFTLSKDHYFSKESRIFPRTLWWYIYLSMQRKDGREDLEATVELLLTSGSTDTITQLIDRTGKEGYRTDLYQELIEDYCGNPDYSQDDLRRIMVLNNAMTETLEPKLCQGGNKKYVKELFDYFPETKNAQTH